MAEYLAPLDIKNRALQHCGVPRIVTETDDAKGAAETAFAYDKVRTAELRRNAWRFAIRKAALRAVNWDTMFLVPVAYQTAKTYPIGAVVAWQNETYFSTAVVPINTPPDANPSSWTVYFGPMTVTPWAASTGYYAGELVYVVTEGATDSDITVFMSLQSDNVDDPTHISLWDATKTYFKRETVSLPPADVFFDGARALFNGAPVFFNPGLYQSTTDLNVGNQPGASSDWEQIPPTEIDLMAGQNWLQVDATIVHRRIVYPLQAGPKNQTTTRNVFQLPNGFLKQAPQDPKAGASSYLGAPSGLPADDWELEGNWLVSTEPLIVLRFVADVADVTLMDPMFCEGLGARLALEVCEPLTQSDARLNTISQIYKTMMGDARAVDGIEAGPIEPPLDDYLACRG